MRAILAMGSVLAVLLGMSGAVLGDSPAAGDRAEAPLAVQIEHLAQDADGELQAFYALRDHRPAWRDRETVAAFAAALHTLDGDGLRPEDYRPDALVAGHRQAGASGEVWELARFDLHATRVLMTALEHLQRGKVDPRELDTHWEVPVEAPARDPAAIARAIEGQRFEQAFAEARPSYAPYERLRAGLARYRNIERLGGWEPLPDAPRVLRPGDVDDAVALLRLRLAVIGELEVMAADADAFPGAMLETPDPRRFDATLEAAVRRFQRRHLLEVDGLVGPQTRRALNVPVEARIDQIRVNLERARWLLHGLPESFVLVDIAGYQLRYFRPSGEVWRSRIVVGRPYRRTRRCAPRSRT